MQIAKADIVSHFDALPHNVLKVKEIRAILAEQRGFWRLAQNTTGEHFLSFLEKHAKFKRYDFPFPQRAERCYAWGDVPFLTILLGLKKDLYFSHYTAMRMHGLTEQLPKSIYLTDERKVVYRGDREPLNQSAIDTAFGNPARTSNNWVEYDNKKIYLLNGADSNYLGVGVQQATDESGKGVEVRATNVERTLIDAVVRPAYVGGVFEVVKAFALARDRLSVNKLIAMLKKLDFVYPYHQAIGYYLERAGCRSSQLDLVRRLPLEYDFYLDHDMGETRYEPSWRLFVPKGF
jgi:hypothetical protein